MTGRALLLLVVSVQCAVSARQRKLAAPLTVSWINKSGNRSVCGGVALTRHHVLASRACIGVQEDSFRVELRKGKGESYLATPIQISGTDKGSVILLSLRKPIPLVNGVTVGVPRAGRVRVVGEKKDVQCQLENTLNLVCDNPGIPALGWPVFGVYGNLLGFLENMVLEPIKGQLSMVGDAIASDFAKRFSNGETRLFKCKKTETQALDFILKSLNSDRHTDIMMRDVSKDNTENELDSVVFELKMELAGRDNQIASLENQLKTLTNGAKELQTSLQHKENGIAQLKSQLEYQCLGQNFKLIPGCINKNCS